MICPAIQAGQRSRLQTATEERSFMKKVLNFASKSDIFRIILICSDGNDSQIFGKLYKGKESSLAKLE